MVRVTDTVKITGLGQGGPQGIKAHPQGGQAQRGVTCMGQVCGVSDQQHQPWIFEDSVAEHAQHVASTSPRQEHGGRDMADLAWGRHGEGGKGTET